MARIAADCYVLSEDLLISCQERVLIGGPGGNQGRMYGRADGHHLHGKAIMSYLARQDSFLFYEGNGGSQDIVLSTDDAPGQNFRPRQNDGRFLRDPGKAQCARVYRRNL
jgi:hypothetical protein